MASYTVGKNYHVTVTLKSPSGKVNIDASCGCKASSMDRCNHVAALLFAIEDYVMNFGYEIAPTEKLCKWNLGRTNKHEPQVCYTARYSKKTKS